MLRRLVLTFCACGLALSGCAMRPNVNAVELSDVSLVVSALKEELRAYAKWAPPQVNMKGACFDPKFPQYDLYVQNATIDLNTKDSFATGKTIKLPDIPPVSITGPSRTDTTLNNQSLKFDFAFEKPAQGVRSAASDNELSAFPIAAVINRVRNQIIAVDHEAPCISYGGDGKTPPLTLVIGFTVTREASAGLQVVIVPVTVGGTITSETVVGQTLTLKLVIANQPDALMLRLMQY